MNTVNQVLSQMKTVVKNINTTNKLGDRVWTNPYESDQIRKENFPFAVISKLNAEVGGWDTISYGVGRHTWEILIAVYLAPGPIVPTISNKETIETMKMADEWYEKMAAALSDNMTLGGTVDIIGSPDGNQLFEYVTDNIIWDANQFYGHLFSVPVTQTVVQATST